MTEENKTLPDDFHEPVRYWTDDERDTWDDDHDWDDWNPDSKIVQAKARAIIQGLRDFAEHLEAHPVAAYRLAEYDRRWYSKFTFQAWSGCFDHGDDGPVFNPSTLNEERRAFGLARKFIDDGVAGFYKDFGPVRFILGFSRTAVCRMEDTGETETVPVPKVVQEAVVEEELVTRPVLKKVCDPIWTSID